MNQASLVLDADAVVAYAGGSLEIGERICDAADEEDFILVPALCLTEAYRRTDSNAWHYLDVLSSVDATVVTPIRAVDAAILGGLARRLGSEQLAHAVLEAATHPITPIMTSQRDRVTQILAKGWPIIDI